jgi:hypothetical protein
MEHEMRKRAEASDAPENPATRTALAFRTLSDDSRSLDLINRYESRYDRQYLRAHRRFLELQDRRTPPPAAPAPVSRPQPETIDSAKRTRETGITKASVKARPRYARTRNLRRKRAGLYTTVSSHFRPPRLRNHLRRVEIIQKAKRSRYL